MTISYDVDELEERISFLVNGMKCELNPDKLSKMYPLLKSYSQEYYKLTGKYYQDKTEVLKWATQ
jgi:hypothetical protein